MHGDFLRPGNVLMRSKEAKSLSLAVASVCSIENCLKSPMARGWCVKHYGRWRRNGDPTVLRQPLNLQPDHIRFFAKVDAGGDCWLWTGYVAPNGYGRFGSSGKILCAHVWAWQYLIGQTSEGLQLDHLCRVRSCVNPDHLEPVTQKENWARSYNITVLNARKTHCPQGHEYKGENLRIQVLANGTRARFCRACSRAESRRRRLAAQGPSSS
jgi:hypothetical protein